MNMLDRFKWFGSACSINVCDFIESFCTRQPQRTKVRMNHLKLSSPIIIKRHPCFWRYANIRITLTSIPDADLSAKTYSTILES